ncbi:MAG: hypothetical protein WDZ76_15170 [Pseudohongiellaceae bacterium]
MIDYFIAWLVYGIAAAIFYFLFWKITQFRKHRLLSHSLRAVMLALIVTPWYVGPDGGFLAPALMVVVLNAITAGGEAAIGAFVPLFLAVVIAFLVALVEVIITRNKRA